MKDVIVLPVNMDAVLMANVRQLVPNSLDVQMCLRTNRLHAVYPRTQDHVSTSLLCGSLTSHMEDACDSGTEAARVTETSLLPKRTARMFASSQVLKTPASYLR